MKRGYVILLVNLLCIFSGFSQGWHIQKNNLLGPFYRSTDSILYCTFNAGVENIAVVNPQTMDWKYVRTSNYPKHMTQLAMKNAHSAVAISSGTLQYSTDNLQNFTKVTPELYSTNLFATKSGYVSTSQNFSSIAFHYSPDGINWTLVMTDNSNAALMGANGNTVVVLGFGSGNYYKSTNGGASYTFVSSHPSSYPTSTPTSFQIFEENIWYINTTTSGEPKLYRSFNAGGSWDNITLPSGITKIKFKNKAEGILYDGTNFKVTLDSGKTWSAVSTMPPNATADIAYAGNYILLGRDYISHDNGATWKYFLPMLFGNTSDVFDIDFYNNTTGIAVGSAGIFAISKNGGKSFDFRSNKICPLDVMAVKMLNENTIYAGDRNGQVWVSTDQGTTWTQKFSNGTTLNAQKFSCSENGNLIVMTRSGQPVVSSDGGATFNFISVGGGAHSQSVTPAGDMLDAEGIFNYTTFTNDGWRINKINTTNGSKTPLRDINDPKLNLLELHMVNNSIGYLVTSYSTTNNMVIFKTTDGWSTVKKLTEIPPYISGSAGAYGKTHLFTFGDTIIVAHLAHIGSGKNYYHSSYNGGIEWQVHLLEELPFRTLGVHFFSGKRFMYGMNGATAYLNNDVPGAIVAGNTTSVILRKEEYKTITLFPNPVSDAQTIYFPEDMMSKKLEISVYDNQGKLILKTMSDQGQFSPGTLEKGLYMFLIHEEGQIVGSGKFIKQ